MTDSLLSPSYEEIPHTIGPYHVQSDIANGTFGHVISLIHTKTNKIYAGKVISRKYLIESQQFLSFEQECRIQKQLNHPNIVAILDIIYLEKYIVVIMNKYEYNAVSYIYEHELTQNDIWMLFAQLVNGLSYLHDRGIAHRDLKLDNLLIKSDGTLSISDFGCCEVQGRSICPVYYGTPIFAPPEMETFKGDPKDFDVFKADVWATGILLFLLITKRYPWNSFKLRAQEIREFANYIPPSFSEILLACCQESPQNRLTINELKQMNPLSYYLNSFPTKKTTFPKDLSRVVPNVRSFKQKYGSLSPSPVGPTKLKPVIHTPIPAHKNILTLNETFK